MLSVSSEALDLDREATHPIVTGGIMPKRCLTAVCFNLLVTGKCSSLDMAGLS